MTRVTGLSAMLINICRSLRWQIGAEGWGGRGGWVSGLVVFIVLRFLSTCSKPIFVAQGSPKTYVDSLYISPLISYLSKFIWLVFCISMITVQLITFFIHVFFWNSWSCKANLARFFSSFIGLNLPCFLLLLNRCQKAEKNIQVNFFLISERG